MLQDRGFYGYRPLAEGIRRGVHLLGRVGKHVVFERTETLSDGPYPAVIYPSRQDRRHQTHGLIVRVSEYTLDAPNRTAHGERHRLVTTLLDADQHPAKESVVLYHQRWEIEIGNDDANPACQAATLSDKKRQVLRSLSDNGSRTSRGRSPNVPDAMMPRVRRERHRPASWRCQSANCPADGGRTIVLAGQDRALLDHAYEKRMAETRVALPGYVNG